MTTPPESGSALSGPSSSPPPGAASRTVRAHASLFPYALSILAATVIVHLIIVLAGNHITVLTTLPLVVVAIGYAVYLIVFGRALGRVRYGRLVAHALTYAMVNTGYLLHAYILVASASPAIQGDDHLALDAGWFGASLGMAGFWGIGLICHGLAALRERGFEASRP
ncbi:hypothetical protein [Brachybacterium fresconis]|uniref:Uncharacterized protein n=1 Tax=Brachybacterium fresconis TaxID=173363 RepID=A0ABS4YMA9_9MICO|nr:hypothetical protein [Brachybacterium fresconis]MBP2409942.1 hypothetical protein [Brachybacterium fresconis]